MIAAIGQNGVIGRDQSLPWRIPSDFAWFKWQTLGKPIIMGRKQFETVGRPLPDRTNIVITRRKDFAPDGVMVVDSPEAALLAAQQLSPGDGEIMIIGGGQIYHRFMKLADRLYITHVHLAPHGDVFFPDIAADEWVVVDQPELEPDPRDQATYRVKVYERRDPGAH
jgi:dihydrofolate reductase